MLLAGKNITSANDQLVKLPVAYLYNSLRNPKSEMLSKMQQLRVIQNLDPKQYSYQKRQLPYFVCAAFSPSYRRTENFAYTEYFVVDLDHLHQKGMEMHTVRQQIEQDSRVHLCFQSPSADGLKILFKLKEKCSDSGLYSLFYKSFVQQFAKEFNIEQVVDIKTCDVARACFVSVDANAYYNESPELVDWQKYINTENSYELFELKKAFDKQEKEALTEEKTEATPKAIDPDADALQRIKQMLNPNARKTQIKENNAYVPEELNLIMSDLRAYIENTGVVIAEIVNIHYGKKLRLKLGLKLAEVNLFYGKRGFSVVISPRCGTNAELNQMMVELIQVYINEKA